MMGSRGELRVVRLTRQGARKWHQLIDPCQTDKGLHDAGQCSLLSPKQGSNQVELEEADEAPVECTNDNQQQRKDVHSFHDDLLEVGEWMPSAV